MDRTEDEIRGRDRYKGLVKKRGRPYYCDVSGKKYIGQQLYNENIPRKDRERNWVKGEQYSDDERQKEFRPLSQRRPETKQRSRMPTNTRQNFFSESGRSTPRSHSFHRLRPTFQKEEMNLENPERRYVPFDFLNGKSLYCFLPALNIRYQSSLSTLREIFLILYRQVRDQQNGW